VFAIGSRTAARIGEVIASAASAQRKLRRNRIVVSITPVVADLHEKVLGLVRPLEARTSSTDVAFQQPAKLDLRQTFFKARLQ
jgi:hypothetical protein